MDLRGLYLNNLQNLLFHLSSAMKVPIVQFRRHLIIRWDPCMSCLLTTVELCWLRRRFSHPANKNIVDVLERSETENIGQEIRRALKARERACDPFPTYAQRPERFKFTLEKIRSSNTQFTWIPPYSRKPVLHVVDESTRLQSAGLLSDILSETLWKAL